MRRPLRGAAGDAAAIVDRLRGTAGVVGLQGAQVDQLPVPVQERPGRVILVLRSANDVAALPGVMTPTEVTSAVRLGVTIAKFFPAAAAGGTATLRAMSAVFPSVGFVPTGGVTQANLSDYLTTPGVVACGGSWLADRETIAGQDLATITDRTRQAVATVEATRSGP